MGEGSNIWRDTGWEVYTSKSEKDTVLRVSMNSQQESSK